MAVSRQVVIPLYGSFVRQRGRGFGALAQSIRIATIQFFSKNTVPVANSLEFAVPDLAEVDRGRKNFRTAAKMWQMLKKQ